MTRRTRNYDDVWHPYDSPHHDEREESISASEHGHAGSDRIGSWRDDSSWGGRDE